METAPHDSEEAYAASLHQVATSADAQQGLHGADRGQRIRQPQHVSMGPARHHALWRAPVLTPSYPSVQVAGQPGIYWPGEQRHLKARTQLWRAQPAGEHR